MYPRPQIATTNIVLFVKDIENVPIFHVSDSAIVTPHCRYINLQWGSYSDFLNNIATVTLPINYKKSNFLVLATDFAGTYTGINNKAIQNKNLNSISILQANEGNGDSFLWFSIGV